MPFVTGYKLITLCTSFGYVINFTPDGKNAAKWQQKEYKTSCVEIMFIIQSNIGASESNTQGHSNEKNCITMDYYFTLPK
eukprot:6782313-Ditylum_brightwellii.AAC.1